jgi:hypothetical protein
VKNQSTTKDVVKAFANKVIIGKNSNEIELVIKSNISMRQNQTKKGKIFTIESAFCVGS